MAKTEMEVVQLVLKLIGHKTGDICKTTYSPQKVKFPEHAEGETHLPHATPEEMGVDTSFIYELFSNLYDQNNCHMHKIMVVRKGHIIGECAYAPFDMDTWHITHSMCKSVTGMAIGFLIYEGKLSLDDKISDIFSSVTSPIKSLISNGMTIRNLLTMTSGSSFNETGIVVGDEWSKLFLDAKLKVSPGSTFDYNSMNSYMLSSVVTKITGMSMFEYLKPRLFDKLGIKRVFWEESPEKITKGGWGMLLRMEDMAKLAILYINKGMYNGEQLLPPEWVEDATKAHVETGKMNAPGYGYQLWTNVCREGAYTFNGMLGQNAYVFPDIDMVVVTNAGNEDLFQKGNLSNTIYSHMKNIKVSENALPVTDKVKKDRQMLTRFLNNVENTNVYENKMLFGGWNNRRVKVTNGRSKNSHMRIPLNKSGNAQGTMQISPYIRTKIMKCLDNVTYDLDDQGVGIMPILIQILHNNYTDGIKSIGFRYDENKDLFYLVIKEGESEIELLCGFDKIRRITDIDEHGESYKIATVSEFSTDEYGRVVLRNELYFLEDSSTRVMNIYFGKREPLDHGNSFGFESMLAPTNIGVRFDEIPGNGIIYGVVDMYGDSLDVKGLNGFVYNQLNNYGAMDAIYVAIRHTMRPRLHGTIHFDENISDIGVGINPDLGYDNVDNEAITEED
ncbi:MAG: serine hydrolase [Butyrivibrio sp.]|nr:serine hydrolase [Butyrivibrio sp.]